MSTNNLKNLHDSLNVSQTTLSNASSVAVSKISEIESGKRDINNISVVTALKIARALRINVVDLLDEETRESLRAIPKAKKRQRRKSSVSKNK